MYIYDRAFANCTALRSLRIPDGALYVAENVFEGCTNLTVTAPSTLRGTFTVPETCTIEYYDPSAIVESDVDCEVTENGDGSRTVAVVGDETLAAEDIHVSVMMPGEYAPVDVTEAYNVSVAADGKSATVTLKAPPLGAAAIAAAESAGVYMVAEKDEGDRTGALVDAAAVVASLGADAIKAAPDLGGGEELGAMPVKAVRGLWYQASWGDSLDGMTDGAKVQATDTMLYLGVVRQTGDKGFYRLKVSEH